MYCKTGYNEYIDAYPQPKHQVRGGVVKKVVSLASLSASSRRNATVAQINATCEWVEGLRLPPMSFRQEVSTRASPAFVTILAYLMYSDEYLPHLVTFRPLDFPLNFSLLDFLAFSEFSPRASLQMGCNFRLLSIC